MHFQQCIAFPLLRPYTYTSTASNAVQIQQQEQNTPTRQKRIHMLSFSRSYSVRISFTRILLMNIVSLNGHYVLLSRITILVAVY